MNRRFTQDWLALGTVVRIHIVSDRPDDELQQGMLKAMEAMRVVEAACSRFDTDSELVRLLHAPVGTEVPLSPILFQSLQFACEVANWTDGRFDPTIGSRMEELGFRRHYLTGELVESDLASSPKASFRDIELNADLQTVRLHCPLKLDLGAVAKGLAVDLAVQELAALKYTGFVVDAGGDVYAAGMDMEDQPWKIGIRHPIHKDKTIMTLQGSNIAVCTSGTYERISPLDINTHHILNAHSRNSARGFLSVTAVGPYTMMTDAFSTAAFLYSPAEALSLLEEVGLEGILVTEDLRIEMTSGMGEYLHESN